MELANGKVALILTTDGLENSGLPHSDLPADSLRPRRVMVALLHPFDDRHSHFSVARSQCLAPDCRYVPEVFITDNESLVSTQDIVRICFVFHPSMPCLKLVCIQGMSSVYVCRYNQTGADIDMELRRRFPSDYQEYIDYHTICVSSTVWKAVSATQQAFPFQPLSVARTQLNWDQQQDCLTSHMTSVSFQPVRDRPEAYFLILSVLSSSLPNFDRPQSIGDSTSIHRCQRDGLGSILHTYVRFSG